MLRNCLIGLVNSPQNKKIPLLSVLLAVTVGGVLFLGFKKYIETKTKPQIIGVADNNPFLEWKENKAKLPAKEEEVSIIAVGDISFSRGVERMIKINGGNMDYPFLNIADYLRNADITLGNLETTITPGREIQNNEMVFRSNPGTEKALKNAGFSLISLANNHTPDFGEKGLKDTINYLKKEDIDYLGAGMNLEEANEPVYIEKKGINFAFIAYNDSDVVPESYGATETSFGTNFMDIKRMKQTVEEAKEEADLVIVIMHSGTEYVQHPNDRQIEFAHEAVDAGAEIVIAHHPHVVQTIEKYQGKYILYSLGNFVFDQAWSKETMQSLIAKIYLTKEGVSKITFQPAIIENYCQPRPANKEEAEEILQRLEYPLQKRVRYAWNSHKNTFEKNSKATLYENSIVEGINKQKEEKEDLNNNSIQETYQLKEGSLKIKESSSTIWQSPENWWVDDFILADSNNDGNKNLNLSVWKAGSFGEEKPLWKEDEDKSIGNHLFVYDVENGEIKPVWQSSRLPYQNKELTIDDIDQDQKNELIVIETDYTEKGYCKNNYIGIWEWENWGFTKAWQSEQGNYCNLEIESLRNNKQVVVDSF